MLVQPLPQSVKFLTLFHLMKSMTVQPQTSRGGLPLTLMECDLNFYHAETMFFISSFNTRTLNPFSRLSELVLNAKLHKIDIIAIQEHRFFHPDDAIKYHKVEDFQLVTASCSKNFSIASVVGVCLLLSPRAMENLSKVEVISPQVIIADFEGNPKTTIISCHSPHNNSSDDDIEHFYTTLRSTIENVPAHNFLLIPGDFNAKLSPDNAKFTFHSETNRNGEHLV